jgi:chromosome segregation ATPase
MGEEERDVGQLNDDLEWERQRRADADENVQALLAALRDVRAKLADAERHLSQAESDRDGAAEYCKEAEAKLAVLEARKADGKCFCSCPSCWSRKAEVGK